MSPTVRSLLATMLITLVALSPIALAQFQTTHPLVGIDTPNLDLIEDPTTPWPYDIELTDANTPLTMHVRFNTIVAGGYYLLASPGDPIPACCAGSLSIVNVNVYEYSILDSATMPASSVRASQVSLPREAPSGTTFTFQGVLVPASTEIQAKMGYLFTTPPYRVEVV